MRKRWTIFFASVAAAFALLAAACTSSVQAQEGVLENIDSVSGEVIVKLKDGGTVTFNLRDVKVETLRSVLGTVSFEPGTRVVIEIDNERVVKRVKGRVAEVEGILKRLDSDKKTVTITSEKRGDIVLEVTETTKIEMDDDHPATFADLREGQEIEAKFDVESKKALKIEVEEEEDEAELEGTITAINKDAKTVTIRGRNGVEGVFTVTPATELKNHGVVTFSDLRTGLRVEAEFFRASRELTELEIED